MLSKHDLEKIIKDKYSGVKSIKFSSKNPKITLELDALPEEKKFVTTSIPMKSSDQHISSSRDKMSKEEIDRREKKVGSMSSVGERNIVNL